MFGLQRQVELFDPRNRWLGYGRTILAVAQLTILTFTSPTDLLVPIIGQTKFPHCDGVAVVSLYCIGGDLVNQEWRRWLMVAILIVVATGYRPRFTAIPQAWISWSISMSISLPDGGDTVAKLISLILIPVVLVDNRKWHWSRPVGTLSRAGRGIALAFTAGVRIQVFAIYIHSGLGKLAVADWTNGSAEYYVVRDKMFGATGALGDFALWATMSPLVTISVTWGTIAVETFVAIAMLCGNSQYRRIALFAGLALHLGIIATMGLWSFSLIMIGTLIIAAMPDSKNVAQLGDIGETDDDDARVAVTSG